MDSVFEYLLTKYDALVLDVDGSSARNEPMHLKTVQTVMNGHGHLINWPWWQKNLGSGQDGIYHKLCAEIPGFKEKITEKEFIAAWISTYCDTVRNSSRREKFEMTRPGIVQLAREFKRAGKPLAANSASERAMVEANLQAIRIRPMLQFALAAEDLREHGLRPKDAPDSYTYSFNKLGVPAHRVLVVEDTIKGVRAAQRAGAGGIIGVHYANQPPHEGATYHVHEEGHLVKDMINFLNATGAMRPANNPMPAIATANQSVAAMPLRVG